MNNTCDKGEETEMTAATPIYRMRVTNRTSGKPIRDEYVQCENIDIAFDVVRARLNIFERCYMGSPA